MRLRVAIRGAVQGVGFRPFVYRLATKAALTGWVNNTSEGVFIEAEGPRDRLESFLLDLEKQKPPRASIQSLEYAFLDPKGYDEFEIRTSEDTGAKSASILPDIATCPDCLAEVMDPSNRRHRYPFTNCTNCGPRFSIIEQLPYDRPNTTMKAFTMCDACRAEYEDPKNRRFHAQPNACPECGPHLELWDESGNLLSDRHDALLKAVEAIRDGKSVAVKGLGGFHLVADARNKEAVERLRARKNREEKPFALMFPSLDAIRVECDVSALEERLLLSPESPIVLLRRRADPSSLPARGDCWLAPHNPYLGCMLPYTPLHHLLIEEVGGPVVATSGNLSEEPICTDERDALSRLKGMADLFLVHNRPIARHVDDSIVRVSEDRELVLRRARGYAPLPVWIHEELPTLLAVGPHLKNTVAIGRGNQVFVSQHIGDLETPKALKAFRSVIEDFQRLYAVCPSLVAHDMHPDYISTKHARGQCATKVPVQHHHAHIAACMAENELDGQVLGVSWDGTGYGTDGTVWGGEFLRSTAGDFERIAHFRTFRLPGGETAIREPRRTALGLLYEVFGGEVFNRDDLKPLETFSPEERKVLSDMLEKSVNAPMTSSAGRLFDALASITGVKQVSRYEGQAAMEMEYALADTATDESYPLGITGEGTEAAPWAIDWSGAFSEVIKDSCDGVPVGLISAKFHNMLIEAIVEVAKRCGEERVVLSGGCFQNRYLTERSVHRLKEEGFRPYWHQRIPPNDGGISLGQAVVAGARREE